MLFNKKGKVVRKIILTCSAARPDVSVKMGNTVQRSTVLAAHLPCDWFNQWQRLERSLYHALGFEAIRIYQYQSKMGEKREAKGKGKIITTNSQKKLTKKKSNEKRNRKKQDNHVERGIANGSRVNQSCKLI